MTLRAQTSTAISIPAGPPVTAIGLDGPLPMVAVPLVAQLGNNWCWAACGEMVDRARRGDVAVQQCELASQHVALGCCGRVPPSSSCDQPLALTKILEVWLQLNINAVAREQIALDIIVDELRARRPVQICISDSRRGHVLLIVGANRDGSQFMLLDPLPRDVGACTVVTAEHLYNGWERLRWSHTWTNLSV